MSNIVLGIDPGSRKMGFGVIRAMSNNFEYLGSGFIATDPQEPFHLRLLTIFDAVSELVASYTPAAMAIEEVFVSRNVQSTIKLSEARSVAMVAAAKSGIGVFEYTPMQIKQAVVGYGAAAKHQVQFMVKQTLQLSSLPQVDASDALACAMCHAYTAKINQAMGHVVGMGSSVRGRYRRYS